MGSLSDLLMVYGEFKVCIPCILHAVTLFELVEELFPDNAYKELKSNLYKLSIASML